MKAFHLDFNTALFRPDYLRHWLHELAGLGFNTLIWEVENAFQWKSCPECAVADTLPISELKSLLALARSLNFENIPLFQTLGHCEYVLKHEHYAHLRENGCIDQYCPSNPDLMPFLTDCIEEYLAVFEQPRYFHVGADETMQLATCPQCKAYADTHGVARLYRNHMDRVIKLVTAKGARPLLWADMFLSHPESLTDLSRDIILCDWAYERNEHATQVFLFGHGKFPVEGAPKSAIDAFGDRLYRPDASRRQLNPWVAADHLHAEGFTLILCPASCHAGDAVFAPRTRLHLRNIGDTVRYAKKLKTLGTILTSWTWHQFSWSLQRHLMAYYRDAANGQNTPHTHHLDAYGSERLGLNAVSFANICDLLETFCPLTDAMQLGFFKGGIKQRVGGVAAFLQACQHNDELQTMIAQAATAEVVYTQAYALLNTVPANDNAELQSWKLATACMLTRARTATYLLKQQADVLDPNASPESLIAREQDMRSKSLSACLKSILPYRAEEMVACQFDDVIIALKN